MADDRKRNFACVVYADSAPPDWKVILSEMKIPLFISPYHDKDTNPTGEPKKPHWHVMVMFEGKKTEAQARAIFSHIAGVGLEIIESVRGYARYLCHLDNPEKHRYSPADVIQYGGADYTTICNLVQDRTRAIREMVDFCKSHNINEFSSLLEYAMMENDEWFNALCQSSAIVMKEYIKSRKFRAKEKL